jgi:hypothetical protein
MTGEWRVIAWTLDVAPAAYYEAAVEPDGLCKAQYFEREVRTRLGLAENIGEALLLCARHAETHRVAVPRGCTWRATSWELRAHGRYLVDVDNDASAHAVHVGERGHYEPLGRLADLGQALLACTQHASRQALREAV